LLTACTYQHLNVDHVSNLLGPVNSGLIITEFFYVQAADLDVSHEGVTQLSQSFKNGTIYDDLLASFEALPKTSKQLNYDDYAVVNVSPSLTPNPYLPTFRVFNYNISGLHATSVGAVSEDEYVHKIKMERATRWKHLPYRHGNLENNYSQCRSASYRDSWRCKRFHPWRSDGRAPSRQNSLWSPLGYAQVRQKYFWYVSNLALITDQVLHATCGRV
jgi:endopolyphosphatase